MPGPKPIPLSLSDCQQNILEKIVKRHRTPQQLSKRIRLILLMAQGKNNQQAARGNRSLPPSFFTRDWGLQRFFMGGSE